MKLIVCDNGECNDIVRLAQSVRACKCGKSSGNLTYDGKIQYYGLAIPLGIDDSSLSEAIYSFHGGRHSNEELTVKCRIISPNSNLINERFKRNTD